MEKRACMNVYDFDGTLYRGESSFHFARFCLLKKPKVYLFFQKIISLYRKHKKNVLSLEETNALFKKILDTVLVTDEDLEMFVQTFWKKYEKNLNWPLIHTMKEDDVILSAGPDFLLKNSPLKDKNIICSQIDLKNKKILFFCYGENKRMQFQKTYKGKIIEKFYTDSYSDYPLMTLAHQVYFVKNGVGLGKEIKIEEKKEDLCK